MLLGGLWHGAAWTFVIWGGLHGLYLTVHKVMLRGERPDFGAWKGGQLGYIVDFFKIMLTFHLVCITWVFFRASSLNFAGQYILGIILNTGSLSIFKPVFLAVLILVLFDIGQRYSEDYSWLNRIPAYWRYAFAGSLFLASALVFGWHCSTPTPFIYFQF